MKKEIIEKINTLALNNGSFDQVQALLRGVVSVSKIFKIGEKLVDQAGQPLSSIGNSKIFIEEFMGIKEGRASRLIQTESGLYVFTPILKDIRQVQPSEKDYQKTGKNIEEQIFMTTAGNLRQKLFENAKKVINLKTDSKE